MVCFRRETVKNGNETHLFVITDKIFTFLRMINKKLDILNGINIANIVSCNAYNI